MTPKFKFGDKVSCSYLEENETAIVISHQPQSGSCYVITPDKESFWVDDKALTLIPHPDTVRLDWIENCSKEAGETAILHDGYNFYGYINDELPMELGFPCETLRQAIDNAMQHEQTPC